MRTYIKKLQTKSEESRKQILFVSLTISMFLVISLFVYGLTNRFNEKVQVQAKAKEDAKPLALLGESISSTYKNIVASVGNIPLLNKEVSTEKQINLIVVDKSANQ